MNLNFIDLLLGSLILLITVTGWRRGFLLGFGDLATWVAGLWLSIRFYQPVARCLALYAQLPEVWSKPSSFLAVLVLSLLVLRLTYGKLTSIFPPSIHRHTANKALGLLPALAYGCIHAIIAAALLISLPLPARWEAMATESRLTDRLARYADVAEASLRPVFDDAIHASLGSRTVQPGTNESVKLPFSVKQSTPRPELEAQMLDLVNTARTQAGLPSLTNNDELRSAARKHSADMLARGYFSHYSPEGKSVFDRLRAEKIRFLLAGENLAFAPSVKIAHTGLMNSPGHRANILRPQFGEVGIGIMDAGARGIMVTQNFRN